MMHIKISFILLLMISVLLNNAVAQQLYPVWNAFKKESACESPCGYKNSKNDLKIPMKYCKCDFYYSGYAAVQSDSKWGIIDSNGATVLPFIYDKVTHFFNQYYVASKTVNNTDSSYIFNNRAQQIYAGAFGQYTFYRPLNRIVLQPAVSNEAGKLDMNKIIIFDSTFTELITYYSPKKIQASFVNIQNASKQSHDNSYFVLTETSERDGEMRTLSALYKKTGQKIFDSVKIDQNILLKFPDTDSQRAAVIDSHLNFMIPFSANHKVIKKIKDFPLYSFSKNKILFGIIDQTSTVIIPAEYNDFDMVNQEHIIGSKRGKDGIMYYLFLISGKIIDSSRTIKDFETATIYKTAEAARMQFAKDHGISKGSNGKLQVTDENGKVFIKPEFDDLKYAGGKYIAGQMQPNGQLKYGLINTTGQMLIKVQYDHIHFAQQAECKGHFILSKKDKTVPDLYVGE
jgi:hypothetical protein